MLLALGSGQADTSEPSPKLGGLVVPGQGPSQNNPPSNLIVPGQGPGQYNPPSDVIIPGGYDTYAWAGTEGGQCIFGTWCFWGLRCEHLLYGYGSSSNTRCVKDQEDHFGGRGERCIQSKYCDEGLQCRTSQEHGGRRICLDPILYGSQTGDRLGSALLGHPASHEGAPTVSGFMDSYCPHQCAIWAWNTDTQNWVKDCVRPGWTVAGEYTYPSPMSYETVVCMRDYGHDGWTQWVPEDENSSNKLGTARLGHPASHEGAPTVSGFMDSYCPHQCAIWAWNTDTQNWVKSCVQDGWTVGGEYVYPSPLKESCETVRCGQDPAHDDWTQWQCIFG